MQIFNLLLASLSSAMSLVILVVVLIHYIYLDVKPELIRDIPSLWLTAILFGLIASLAWLSVWARGTQRPFTLWVELATALIGGACIALMIALFR